MVDQPDAAFRWFPYSFKQKANQFLYNNLADADRISPITPRLNVDSSEKKYLLGSLRKMFEDFQIIT